MTEREFPQVPLVGVGGVVVDGDGRVLLIRRGKEPMKGHWSIPGGLVELGETLEQAVVREMAEETGLTVEPVVLAELLDRIYREDKDGVQRVRYHYVLADYVCRVVAGEAAASSDAAEVAWATRAEWMETNRYDLQDYTRDVIEKGWQMARERGIHAA